MVPTSPQAPHAIQVLLYIEHRATAARLNALLTQNGMAVTSAHTSMEFNEAAALGFYCAAITNTWLIDEVCVATRLPVINVEKFIYTIVDQGPEARISKRFDARRFLDDVHAAADDCLQPRFGSSQIGNAIQQAAAS